MHENLTSAGSDEDTRKKALVIAIPVVSVTVLLLVVLFYIYMRKRKHKGKFLSQTCFIYLNYVPYENRLKVEFFIKLLFDSMNLKRKVLVNLLYFFLVFFLKNVAEKLS